MHTHTTTDAVPHDVRATTPVEPWKPTRRRDLGVGLLALIVAMAITLVAGADAEAQRRLCGGPLNTQRGVFSVEVERGSLRCKDARALIRAYFNASRSRCQGSSCVMRVRRYTCITNRFAGPAAATCTRKRTRINAYTAGD